MQLKGLTKNQRNAIDIISTSKLASQFYFSGGTALASAYLQHRRSEDLDFFSVEEFDPTDISLYLSSKQKQLQYTDLEIQNVFNRNIFFLKYPDESLKLEFTYYPFEQLELGQLYGQLRVDSIRDIAANKLFTLYQRPRSRDYIDLYYILQTTPLDIKKLYFDSKIKFDWHIDPLQLGANFLRFDPSDMNMLSGELEVSAVESFYKKLADDLKSSILKP